MASGWLFLWSWGGRSGAVESVAATVTESQALFGKLAMDANGKTLRSKLNEEQLAVYEAAMAKLGLPAATLDPFEPWAAAVTMQVLAMTKAGYQPGSGAESVLTSAAKQAKMLIKGPLASSRPLKPRGTSFSCPPLCRNSWTCCSSS